VPGDLVEALLAITALGAVVALVMVISRKGRTEDRARAYLAGVTYVLSDDADAAIAELSRAAQLSSHTLETYFALGALFRRKGDLDRAIRLHQNILLRPGLSPELRRVALLALAEDYRRSGLRDKAAETLQRLLATEPDSAEALVALRQLHEEARDFGSAAELQARLVKATGAGEEILAHLLAACAHEVSQRSPAEAVEVARRAHQLLPGHAHPLFELGAALLAAGEGSRAADSLQRAVAAEPELAPRAAAPLLASLGAEGAVAFLRGQMHAAGDNAAPWALALARCYRDTGQTEEAIRTLRGAVERRPWRWDARRELGTLLLRQDRSEELRADYQEILGRLGDPVMGFACGQCAQKLPEHAFRCPACGGWDCVRRDPAAIEN
jgi:lipopolysaccharide biosynthesis regulator YciM